MENILFNNNSYNKEIIAILDAGDLLKIKNDL